MINKYIFTITAGRSGQSTLKELLVSNIPESYVAFEEPSPHIFFKGVFGDLESKFRRKYIETNELLGRGKILAAYESNDFEYINKIAKKRLKSIQKKDVSIYIDISKFFARGLHVGFLNNLVGKDIGLIRLVRDPLLNMRSFLNRNKRFSLDNNMPDANSNILKLDSRSMELGELYLWAWCEMYLRFDYLVKNEAISKAVEIRTEHLNDVVMMNKHLQRLGLEYEIKETIEAKNTNVQQGRPETIVSRHDVKLLESFLNRLSSEQLSRIKYFDDYNIEKHVA
jgi:hypothetical protein